MHLASLKVQGLSAPLCRNYTEHVYWCRISLRDKAGLRSGGISLAEFLLGGLCAPIVGLILWSGRVSGNRLSASRTNLRRALMHTSAHRQGRLSAP